jgi:eukaryotic-like serine/threonine-protein kinase
MKMQVVCGKCSRVLEYAGDRPSFCSYCGSALAETMANSPTGVDQNAPTLLPDGNGSKLGAAVPQSVGGYRLLRALGAGGMGSVYEAEETASGRRVALKLIGASFATSADAIERFRQEGRIASMLVHPRCVFVLNVDEDAGRPYIVMELMEGTTLKDLVERRGPLSPEEAVAKTLDVIEGLQAAHRIEVIHRDVKPSNCFLEPDGRVKVGDFGLAKSLVKESHLTKTGAFVGTPHFASPEQVRGDGIDRQTDVYSVAATLYYLLTGQPPFFGSDPTATLARIVSDPFTPLRRIRPELPAALDRVVMRGLDRDRKRRWQDLESFKQALLSLKPSRLSIEGLAMRAAAFTIDAVLIWLVALAVFFLAIENLTPASLGNIVHQGLLLGLFIGYFAVLEKISGCTLGKGLFGLPVTIRTLLCSVLAFGPLLGAVLYWLIAPQAAEARADSFLQTWFPWLWGAVAAAVLLAPMRPRTNWRGLHETLSGTQVAHFSWPKQRQALEGTGGWLLSFLGNLRIKQGMPHLSNLPEKMAGYAIRGALKWTPHSKVLLGEDAALGRRVLLWLRPASESPIDVARRDIGRRTRLRWLASGKQGDQQWDALLAPSGCPLPEFLHSEGTLEWSEAHMLLEDMTNELAAAIAEQTLPRHLSPSQVWVQTDGRAQLADFTLALDNQQDSKTLPVADEQRALGLLRQVALMALDGVTDVPLSATIKNDTVPETTRPVLNKLIQPDRYQTVEEFQMALITDRA